MANRKYKVWDKLSTDEKVAMMKVALRNGISNMDEIKRQWNEFALGGKVSSGQNLKAQRQARYYASGGDKKPDNNAEKALKYFMSKGLARHQAAGLIGNLMRESGLNPTAYYHDKDGGAYGIAQWRGDRRKRLFAKYGNKPSFDQQLDYIWEELNSSHKSGLRHLLASKNAEEAARMGMGYYEFSAGPEAAIANMNKWGQDGQGSMNKGIANANKLMGIYPPTTSEKVLSSPTPTFTLSPDSALPAFMPRNPEAFFAPLSTYTRSMVVEEPVQPVVDLAAQQAAQQREEERERRANGLALLMSVMGGSGRNNYLSLLSSLSGQ